MSARPVYVRKNHEMITGSDLPLWVNFRAAWSGSCKVMVPQLAKAARLHYFNFDSDFSRLKDRLVLNIPSGN